MFTTKRTIASAFVFIFLCAFIATETKASTIDLSGQAYDPDVLYKLDGHWEFYYQKHIDPNDRKTKPDAQVYVPGTWQEYVDNNGEPFPLYGHASYRVIVKLPKGHPGQLSLKIRRIKMAHTLYINGEIHEIKGNTSPDPSEAVSGHYPYITRFTVPTSAKQVELLFHVSNYIYIKSGLNQTILLGSPEATNKAREEKVFISAFVSGALFLIGLYHFAFFFKRRNDSAALVFGLFCVGISLRLLTTDEKYLYQLLPFIGSETVLSLELMSVFFSLPILHILVSLIFPKEFETTDIFELFKKWFGINSTFNGTTFSKAFLILLVSASLFTPLSIHSRLVVPFEIYVLYMLLHIVAVSLMSVIKKEEGSTLFAFGFVALFLTGLNDILFERGVLNTGFYFHIGVMIFVFAQSALLSMRIAGAFNELEELKISLEKKVKDRTHELEELTRENRLLGQTMTSRLEQERRMIAKEIHDGLNPYIVGAQYQLRGIASRKLTQDDIESVKETANQIVIALGNMYELCKTVVRRLRPEQLDALGLQKSLEALLNDFGKGVEELEVRYKIDDCDLLAEDAATSVYRIVQESLTNIIKHAEATLVDVYFRRDTSFVLTIKDNGIGMKPVLGKALKVSGYKVGLISMRERALHHGGSFDIESSPGHGTTITMVLPLTAERNK